MNLLLGDCLDKLKELDDNSVDSIVTDPPYGLGFMGKAWDTFDKSQFGKQGEEGENDLKNKKNFKILPRYNTDGLYAFTKAWASECLRVLKPGGHLLSFAGSRTYHKICMGIEDAGFEIRDQIMWIYGSGFPKSHNIGKAVDKLQGNSEWEGWGTALKPAHEPIVMARKPFKGTVVDNVLEWGTSGINIDESRVGNETIIINGQGNDNLFHGNFSGKIDNPKREGRFPANIILDEEAGKILDEQTGELSAVGSPKKIDSSKTSMFGAGVPGFQMYGDKGGASRFFYCPKTSKRDRNEGLEDLEGKQIGTYNAHSSDLKNYGGSSLGAASMSGNNKMPQPKQNFHPTVKPTDLMLYLIRMVTPKEGTTLDPFMGSGSSGKGAVRGGFDFIGIEREKEYFEIAEARIQYEIDNPYNEITKKRTKVNKNINKFF